MPHISLHTESKYSTSLKFISFFLSCFTRKCNYFNVDDPTLPNGISVVTNVEGKDLEVSPHKQVHHQCTCMVCHPEYHQVTGQTQLPQEAQKEEGNRLVRYIVMDGKR